MLEQLHDEGRLDLHPVTTAHAFPVNTFIENIAVRRTGELLLSVHNTGELIQLNPNSAAAPSSVHVFPTGVLGIVEVEDDIFYIVCGSLGVKGSWAVYKVDMSAFAADSSGNVQTPAKVSKHIDVPDAIFLNGSAVLSASSGTILLADSVLGAVFSANVHSATAKLWLQDKVLAKVSDNPMLPGVNGIQLFDGYLYLSNTDEKTLLRVRVAETTAQATGELELVAENLFIDDFAFDSEGSAYLTTHILQSVVKLGSDGSRSRIAGGPDGRIVAGPTACAFGRTKKDRTILYVTTTGGMLNPIGGTIGPGRVLKIDVGQTGATA